MGAALIRKRTSPQRHPPSIGNVHFAIPFLHALGQPDRNKLGEQRGSVRAPAFWVSVLVLMAMWIGFAVDIAGAQTAYDAAMDNMTI